ncbi:MAG: tRNA lysidine(34) synthetase TilS [Chthoniobacterales bacterium]|nr:tRNA lysidine(34) synthetase TilS [Chthoniobacterales bacterium]
MAARRIIPGNQPAESLRQFPSDKRYLIGISGGRDSVTLLHWLLAHGYGKLIVCHLNHRLRGRSSAADARFVMRLAEANGLPCATGEADVTKLARESKQSIETAARAARYSFFASVARRRRCHTIFLGHHADDLVETYLINLFRGAGLAGQRAIREISTRTVDRVQLTLVRPLLGAWRSEIDEYVNANRLRFREDATNATAESLRNRIRHRIIPTITKEFGRDIRKPVRRAAAIAAEEEVLLTEMLPELSTTLSVAQLQALPVALRRRAIAQWLCTQGVADVGFEMVEDVRSLLDADAGPAKANLTRGRHARRRAGELFIE